ncbi:pyridoxal phosphate-dependent transferase [Syncephalis plumigaleata]|nr:pyridoxal phosphate-dependent transferase [Syncephalis plumigaleata]
MTYTKEQLLQTISSDYGYNGTIDEIRRVEFARLKGTVYLDHTGTTLYPTSTIKAFSRNLEEHVYGNPHSRHPSSTLSDRMVDQTRLKILALFKADPSEYSVVFTSNATAALKLCWEMCPLEAANDNDDNDNGSAFCYLHESHTSVVGLRALAQANHINVKAIDAHDVPALLTRQSSSSSSSSQWNEHHDRPIYSLFIYPAQCNYSGQRFPWQWASLAREDNHHQQPSSSSYHHHQWLVAVDASAYAATTPLDLSDASKSPDFITLSFYKIFGFPTGLGALIVRKSLLPILRKSYFGGGTVSSVAAHTPWQTFRDTLHTRYEDGTVNFLDIIGLGIAIENISEMSALTHDNGRRVCPVITFNLMRGDGSPVGYAELEAIASVNRIHLRTGGFCNPGAAQKWLQLTDTDIVRHAKAGHVCWDDQDIIDGQLTGAVRLSLGAMSNDEDVIAWMNFLKQYYVEDADTSSQQPAFFTTYRPKQQGPSNNTSIALAYMSHITIFPIKSCHGYTLPDNIDWPVTEQGLLYDREWMIVSKETQRALTQKQYPKLATIHPTISLEQQELIIQAPDIDALHVPLKTLTDTTTRTKQVRVCGEMVSASSFDDTIDEWFSNVLGFPCQFVGKVMARSCQLPMTNNTDDIKMGLMNESPFLLIAQSSVNDIMDRIKASSTMDAFPFEHENDYERASRFRGNFIIQGTPAFAEDHWHRIKIGTLIFEIIGPCRRCHMVCIDQKTSRKSAEPYATLAEYRRLQGRILFGQHLRCISKITPNNSYLRVGSKVEILS